MSGSTVTRARSEYFVLSLETPRMNFGRDTTGERRFHDQAARTLKREAQVFKSALADLFADLQAKGGSFGFIPYRRGIKAFYEGDNSTAWDNRRRPCRYVLHLDGLSHCPATATLEIGLAELPPPEQRRELQRMVRRALQAARPAADG